MQTTLSLVSSLLDDAVAAAKPWLGNPEFREACYKLDRREIRYSRNSLRRYGEPLMDAASFVVGAMRSAGQMLDELDDKAVRCFEQLRLGTPEVKLAFERISRNSMDIHRLGDALAATRLQILAGF